MYKQTFTFLLFPLVISPLLVSPQTFTIDYEGNTFLKDGKPFRYISGSIHYFRSPPDKWDDLLRKLRLAGLNAITTYIAWNLHQPTPKSEFDFHGQLNIFEFLRLAQNNGLNVILRPSPFIDAERDMGGLPAWLLWERPSMKLRSSDLEYIYHVSRWYDELLPRLQPLLYSNGGPIITMQVENEYGSFGCDKNYTGFLRDLIRQHLGEDLLLFSTDGAGDQNLKCGCIEKVYPTVDFGPGSPGQIEEAFNLQRKYAPKGPLINSEFYPGWLDHWQHPHNKRESTDVANSLDTILSLGGNVNIYMFHGGTSFGYGAGANIDGSMYDPCVTSYDYDAPLNEAGDPTDKYFAMKAVISKYQTVPHENPVAQSKGAYGKVFLQLYTSVHDKEFLAIFTRRSVTSSSPLSFEQLKLASGFVVYQALVQFKPSDPTVFQAPNLHDRGYVYVDETFVGILSRSENAYQIPLRVRSGQTISILVENQGRVCFGNGISESKGLGANVTLGTHELENWTIFPLGEINGRKLLKYLKAIKHETEDKGDLFTSIRNGGSGRIFAGNFTLPKPTGNSGVLDTFVRLDGFSKGLVWVNGINIGRYWPIVGPQETLYLPSSFLQAFPANNSFMVFELEEAPIGCLLTNLPPINYDYGGQCFVTLTDTHVIDAPTPYKGTALDINELSRISPSSAVSNS